MPITRDDTLLTTDELAGRYIRLGYWGMPTLREIVAHNADRDPARAAYTDGRSRLTWGEVDESARHLAYSLHELGVRKGDVVGVHLPNRVEYVLTHTALTWIGAVCCPISPALRAPEVEFVVGFSGAVAAIVAGDDDRLAFFDDLRRRMPHFQHLVVVGADETAPGFIDFSRLIEEDPLGRAGDPSEFEQPSTSDVERLLFTSGSSGDPKGVLHTYDTTMIGNVWQNESQGVDEDSVMLLFLPVTMNWGMMHVFQTALARCRLILLEGFDPALVFRTIEAEGVTIFGTPPTGLIALLRHEALDRHDLSSLRAVVTAGAPCPLDLLRESRDRLGCPVLEAYGMTEAGWISTTRIDDRLEDVVGTVGCPFPWTSLRLLDSAGADVEAGQPGEIAVSGPSISVGYYRNDDRNRECWTEDGWFRTGDLGLVDEAGRLRLLGRSKEVIKHGGATVWPAEVEEALATHPDVEEVAVFGVPDEYFGENACACIVPRNGARVTLDDLVVFLGDKLARYKLPQRLEVVEELPRTETGKVKKHVLRERVLERGAQERDQGKG